MKFIGTKRFSPIIFLGDVPASNDLFHIDPKQIPATQKEFDKFFIKKNIVIDENWWYMQRDRCINGYSVEDAIEDGGDAMVEGWNIKRLDNGDRYIPDLDITIKGSKVEITGRHYFYLNFWWIKGYNPKIKRKMLIHPRFTDLSWMNWWIRDRMYREEKDNLWCKCRQRGLSEEEACDMAYEFLFYPDSQTVVIGGEDFYNENTMNFFHRGIEMLRNTQFYKSKFPDRKDYVKAENFGSEVYSRTAKNNEQAISGLTPSKVKYEEIGIFKRGLVKSVRSFVEASLEAEGHKTGFSIFTGTGGDMEEGVDDMQEMFYDPKAFGLLEFDNIYEEGTLSKIARFIGAYWFELIDDEGNSLVQESLKKIEEELLKKKPSERITFMSQKPTKPSHVFMIGKGGYFGEEIRQWCNERLAYINTHRDNQFCTLYRLEWKDSTNLWAGVRAEPDPDNGWIWIAEHPETYSYKDDTGYSYKAVYDNLYKTATDSYDQDEAFSTTSMGACTVKKGFLNANTTYNKYVALILERPTTAQGGAEVFFEHTAMATMYWNSINLVEYSKIRIIDWYKRNRLGGLLKERPRFVIAKFVDDSRTQNIYGIDPATKPEWLKMQREYLSNRENIEGCDIPQLLRAWAKFIYDPTGKKYNCDITIASSLCTVLQDDEMSLEIVARRKKTEKTPGMHYTIGSDGRIVAKY